MCFYRLGWIARDNSCFGAIIYIVRSIAHIIALWQVWGNVGGGHQWRPRSVFLVGQPAPTSWVDDVLGEAGFRKAFRLERSVGRSMVYLIAPIAWCLAKGPAMWGNGVSVRRGKSGVCWSSIVMISTKEGILGPVF